jgi:hypothetical protein
MFVGRDAQTEIIILRFFDGNLRTIHHRLTCNKAKGYALSRPGSQLHILYRDASSQSPSDQVWRASTFSSIFEMRPRLGTTEATRSSMGETKECRSFIAKLLNNPSFKT